MGNNWVEVKGHHLVVRQAHHVLIEKFIRTSAGRARLLFLIFGIICGYLPAAYAESQPIPRKILALYEDKYGADPYFSSIHQYAEMPLNHLGLEVIFRPVNTPLPSSDEMKGYLGILTWFRNEQGVDRPDDYCQWVTKQMQAGLKMVILGPTGVVRNKTLSPSCRQMLRVLGLEYGAEFADNPYFFEIVEKKGEMVEFEREVVFTDPHTYQLFRPVSSQAHVHLKVRRTDISNSDSSLVLTTPQGGVAAPTFIIYYNKEVDNIAWFLNPFLFFNEAYGLKSRPRPDITTINGRRIFFSHVDGDGMFNFSLIDRKSLSGEIILEKIFKKYPQVPITASIITGYLDLPKYSGERSDQLYQNLFGLANIEPSSHSYAHPLDWKKGIVSLKLPHYRFDPLQEVQVSLNQVNALLKKLKINKSATLFQWSGNCLPGEDTLAKLSRLSIPNINGGDSQFDSEKNSYAYVAPIGLKKGGGQQIYAGAPNENIYTNLWRGPFYRFRNVIESFKNTESPIRLKPVDIYYHYYSGEHLESLLALGQAYDYALTQNIFPLWTSEYVQIANNFFETEIFPENGGFRVNHNGKPGTIRFDDESRFVDMERSRGILGFNHFQGSLYVSLDDSEESFIVLGNHKPVRPYLIEANFWIDHFGTERNEISFSKRGWGKGFLKMGGMLPHHIYKIRTGDEQFQLRSDDHGQLSITFKEQDPQTPMKVTLSVL